ncbi:MAG: hypothetical protein HC836_40975 [Richelia sp. RM2_1_2]|nr:hypothetical protein [Richelia sp. RM1_1_1]NJO64317.1 hypothetical protein [Richelia sp. RM2_1_2]
MILQELENKKSKKIEEKLYLPEIFFDWNKQFFSFINYLEQIDIIDIATLGPTGTSSETAAKYLLASIKMNMLNIHFIQPMRRRTVKF